MDDQITLKSRIRDWWAGAPMTYGEQHGSTKYLRPDGTIASLDLGSKQFFQTADERFYGWNMPLHDESGYFGKIFNFARYVGQEG